MGNLVCLHSVREDAAVTDGKGMCRIKQRRKQRAGTEEGEEVKKKKKTGTEIRFTLVAGVRDDFPYQQARGSGQI